MNDTLIQKAKDVAHTQKLTRDAVAGEVGCALLTSKGTVYTGVSIDAPCGIGFCAEHTAIATMLTQGESEIATIVAVESNGKILPPCGRCREFIYAANTKNVETIVIVDETKTMRLKDLLPERWQER